MKKLISVIIIFLICTALTLPAMNEIEKDVFQTSKGELVISFVGHGTLMMKFDGMVIHIDPTMSEADYSEMPAADLVLITHDHGDHLDMTALNHIRKDNTTMIITETCLEQFGDAGDQIIVMKNGDKKIVNEIEIIAIPAYNIEHVRSNGEAYHPKGVGNGYLISLGNIIILVAGDTENIPEIKELKGIDIAFLPMNLPYTMTPEMVADAALAFRPKILYPYHFGNTDPQELVKLLANQKDIEVRIRSLD